MSALDEIMARLSVANDDAPCWIERGRDLHTPISLRPPQIHLIRRWAEGRDIKEIE